MNSFLQPITIHLTKKQGRYLIEGKNAAQRQLPAQTVKQCLFFTNRATFFGLAIEQKKEQLVLTTEQLMQAVQHPHPFYPLVGGDTYTTEQIKSAQAIHARWHTPELWQTLSVDDGELVIEETSFTSEQQTFFQQVLQERMQRLQLGAAQFERLLPILQEVGWQEQQAHLLGLRLTEPDEEDPLHEWQLECVVLDGTTKQWTPAKTKKQLPIAQAIPNRLMANADALEIEHQLLLTLLGQPQQDHFFSSALLDRDVRAFLQEDLEVLQAFEIPVFLPTWLKEIVATKVRVQSSASTSYQQATSLDDVLQFNWQFSLGDKQVDRQAFEQLVADQREFIRIGNEWFQMDASWLQKVKEVLAATDDAEIRVKDLLVQEIPDSLQPFFEEQEQTTDPLFEFELQKTLKTYMETVLTEEGIPQLPIPPTIQATLRPYQQEGFSWLYFMREQQLGACLADDMGLGKTLQLITYLTEVVNRGETRPALIICPTSVLGNWQKELEKFAPHLQYYMHYGANRKKDEALEAHLEQIMPHVILTSFGTATQDVENLQTIDFSTIALDEAQNIKNMQTKQSRAIRKLHGTHHIALTGTPIENRLAELWAIFDFIHKGYFGSFKRFTDQYIIPIERDVSTSMKEQLRQKIKPFLLRRTKSDPNLALNLPEKIEQNEYCPLSPEQAALYESFVAETKEQLEQVDGFQRKGLILTMLNRLKQLCNHPALFLREAVVDSATLANRSVKVQRILQMTTELVRNGEQCIIFTQYLGMGRLLQQALIEQYEIEAPFLTGSLSKEERDQLVDRFQSGKFPVFILSLRAGGTGLNLTAANHVLHADRWWNPAVENQATDRAYRIGQTRFVHVHKFVTIGTIEEKVDALLTKKATLSDELIQSNKWLTELDDEELDALFQFDA